MCVRDHIIKKRAKNVPESYLQANIQQKAADKIDNVVRCKEVSEMHVFQRSSHHSKN